MLTIDESPPSVGERYISATQSSNLRLAEGRCDAVEQGIEVGLADPRG